MPSHGVEIIDGIPVYLKGGVIYAFRPESGSTIAQADLRLGTYDSASKKVAWLSASEQPHMDTWVQTFRESLVSRSRK